jgi:Zn-dependent protease
LSIDIVQALVAFLVLLFSLTVHEAAHAWTADRLGDPTARMLGRVSFNPAVHIDPIGTLLFPLVALLSNIPVIGWAKPVPVNLRNLPRARRDFLVVAAAGPASNLLLAVLGAVAWRAVAPGFIAGGGEPGLIVTLVWLLVNINILLAVFNMLPIPPLDGGNVLAGILPEALAQQFDRLRPFGFLILYALLLTGAFGVLVWPITQVIRSWLL